MSKTLNNRFKRVHERIFSRAQKGFVKHRTIQEVLINIIERINYLKQKGKSGAILAIDFKKAFDTIDQGYLVKCLELFGFGEYFIRFVRKCCTNRKARIFMDGDTLSREFSLERGDAQGDGPSPCLFNISLQILLFRLELDVRLVQAPAPPITTTYQVPIGLAQLEHESNRETEKCEAFADDVTLFVDDNPDNIAYARLILQQFADLSGLECNIEKTSIMLLNSRPEQIKDIEQVGFKTVREVKILGLDIDNNLRCLDTAHDKTVIKMRKVKNFWSRFNLSLPGRIRVAKTYLLSQITYLGSFLTPTGKQKDEMGLIIAEYVKGRLNISREKIFKNVEQGGLGLPGIGEFIAGLQCNWVRRADFATCDSWRHTIRSLSEGDCKRIGLSQVSKVENPLIYNIAESWSLFLRGFYTFDNNHRKMSLINNPVLVRGRDDDRMLNMNFFRQNPPIELREITSIRYEDLVTIEGRIRPYPQFNVRTDITLTPGLYLRLANACLHFETTRNKCNIRNECITLQSFWAKFKKGSKKYREYMSNKDQTKSELTVRKYRRALGIAGEDHLEIKNWRVWTKNYYSNQLQEFIFKFLNNLLPINTRLSHYVHNQTRGCTFCEIKFFAPNPDENMSHLFYDCPIVTEWREHILTCWLPNLYRIASNKTVWLSMVDEGIIKNEFFQALKWCFLYTVWYFRLRKKAIGKSTFAVELKGRIKNSLKRSTILTVKERIFNNCLLLLQAPEGE